MQAPQISSLTPRKNTHTLMNELIQGDQSLMLFFNFNGGSYLDSFWYTFSQKYTWVLSYLCILIIFVKDCHLPQGGYDWRRLCFLVISTILVIALADQISSGIIKPLCERLRPSHRMGVREFLHCVNNYRGGRFGFVSSHAANSVALAFWVGHLCRNCFCSITLIAWALITCYSRIYLGVHYPGDIIGGLLIGLLAVWLVHISSRRWFTNLYRPIRRNSNLIPIAFIITSVTLLLLPCF